MAGRLASKAINSLKSKEFRQYICRYFKINIKKINFLNKIFSHILFGFHKHLMQILITINDYCG